MPAHARLLQGQGFAAALPLHSQQQPRRGRAVLRATPMAHASRSLSPSMEPSGLQSQQLSAPSQSPTKAPAMHPDAMRRRREAEARRQQRQAEVQAFQDGKGWWEIDGSAPNQHLIQSPDEFRQRLQLAKAADTLAVCVYFAPWCNACRSLHPKVQQLAQNNPSVTFLEVNASVPALNNMCQEQLGVPKLPYFHLFKGQQGLVSSFAASLEPAKLQRLRAEIMLLRGDATPNNN